METHFSDALKATFGEKRIVCLLHYGSSAFENGNLHESSDRDFCLVLDKPRKTDLCKLRFLCLSHNNTDLTLHYLNHLEDSGWGNFQHGGHGLFFLLHLASANVLLGENIFARKLMYLSTRDVNESLRRQIIEYFWHIDHWLTTVADDLELQPKMQKYMIRIAQDILAMHCDISYQEINTCNKRVFAAKYMRDKSYFSRRTKELFGKIFSLSNTQLVELRWRLEHDFRNA